MRSILDECQRLHDISGAAAALAMHKVIDEAAVAGLLAGGKVTVAESLGDIPDFNEKYNPHYILMLDADGGQLSFHGWEGDELRIPGGIPLSKAEVEWVKGKPHYNERVRCKAGWLICVRRNSDDHPLEQAYTKPLDESPTAAPAATSPPKPAANPVATETAATTQPEPVKRGPGRPKKVQTTTEQTAAAPPEEVNKTLDKTGYIPNQAPTDDDMPSL